MAMYAIIDIFVLGPTFDNMPDEIIVDMIALKSKVVKFFIQFTEDTIKVLLTFLMVISYHFIHNCITYHRFRIKNCWLVSYKYK